MSFGSTELCKCLERLGFIRLPQKATSHIKFKPPQGKSLPTGQKNFIMIQLQRKNYDKHSTRRYIRQIQNFGFTEKEILKHL